MKRCIWVRYAAYVCSIGRGERRCNFIFAFTPTQNSSYIYRLLVMFVVHKFISTAKFHIKNLHSIILKKFIGPTLPHLYFFGSSEEFWALQTKLYFLALQESLFIFWALLQNCEKRLLTFTCLSVRPSACVSLRPYAATRLPLDGYS